MLWRWAANTGPNTCYGGGLLTQVQSHAMEALGLIHLAVL